MIGALWIEGDRIRMPMELEGRSKGKGYEEYEERKATIRGYKE